MKRSEKAALACLGIGAAAAVGCYVLFPPFLWWAYPVGAFIIAALLYEPLIDQMAKETIVNSKKEDD